MSEPEHPPPSLSERDIDWEEVRARFRRSIQTNLHEPPSPEHDDLAQEACVMLLRRMREEGVRSLPGLIRVITLNVARDEIRRRVRRRSRIQSTEADDSAILALPAPSPDDTEDRSQMLWFLLLEYFRARRAPCRDLALAFQSLGDWRRVAEARSTTHEAVRQQWSRCTRAFREDLRRDPGAFADWLDGNG